MQELYASLSSAAACIMSLDVHSAECLRLGEGGDMWALALAAVLVLSFLAWVFGKPRLNQIMDPEEEELEEEKERRVFTIFDDPDDG